MADNNYRSDRGRDPLAELARLIGQGDSPRGDSPEKPAIRRGRALRRRATSIGRPRTAMPRRSPTPRRAMRRRSRPLHRTLRLRRIITRRIRRKIPATATTAIKTRAIKAQGHQDQGYQPQGYQPQGYQDQAYQDQAYQDQGYQDQGYQDHSYHDQGYEEPAGSRFFSGQAGQFNGFREEPSQGLQHFHEEVLPQLPSARDLSAYASALDVHGYRADQQRLCRGRGRACRSRLSGSPQPAAGAPALLR